MAGGASCKASRRVALVLHYLDWASGEEDDEPAQIEARFITVAIAFADEYLVPMAERAHGLGGQTTAHRNTVILAEHILSQGAAEHTVRDLVRISPMRGIGTGSTKIAVNELVGFDWLRAAPIRQGDTPGKLKARYIVNPLVRAV